MNKIFADDLTKLNVKHVRKGRNSQHAMIFRIQGYDDIRYQDHIADETKSEGVTRKDP